MESVLATILALMGVLWTGNLVSFSIGGVDPKVGGLLGLLGMSNAGALDLKPFLMLYDRNTPGSGPRSQLHRVRCLGDKRRPVCDGRC